jgi:hypothetical protein
MTLPPVLLELLTQSMRGDWYGNLILGVVLVAVLGFVVWIAAEARR